MPMKPEQIDRLWKDDANWTWGVIYRCREDPRVIVPRRWRWGGWTLNFSHPKAGLAGLAAVALAVGPGLLAFLVSGDQQTAVAVMLISIVALVVWAHREATRTD